MIIGPSVAVLLRQYLLTGLASSFSITDVKITTEVPAQRPARLVKITRTGGAGMDEEVRSQVTCAVEVWGPTNADAEGLALKVQALINAWEGHSTNGTWVYVSSAGSPVDFPDPDTRTPRYVLQASMVLKSQVS